MRCVFHAEGLTFHLRQNSLKLYAHTRILAAFNDARHNAARAAIPPPIVPDNGWKGPIIVLGDVRGVSPNSQCVSIQNRDVDLAKIAMWANQTRDILTLNFAIWLQNLRCVFSNSRCIL
jgi:hypothetical protein